MPPAETFAPRRRIRLPQARIAAPLLVGWLPVWALFTTLIVSAHPESSLSAAALFALRMVVVAALLGLAVHRLTVAVPWPHPFRARFILFHFIAAGAFSSCWFALNVLLDHLQRPVGSVVPRYPVGPYLVLGVWLYAMAAGVCYAAHATQRAARAEALAARSQLAALRAQLNPHFLFNALHAVVQLIPREPGRAARAAEQLGDLLRATIDREGDLVALADERDFVERYLELERLRFGDRLRDRIEIDDGAGAALVPTFALLTLVENAVRHGAEPRSEPTEIVVGAVRDGATLRLTVRDDGAGASSAQLAATPGSGLRRLRERLEALHGDRARLELGRPQGGGLAATLVLPWATSAGPERERPTAPAGTGRGRPR